jgi:hypothetical protein
VSDIALPGCPEGLRAELARRGATVRAVDPDPPTLYVHLDAPDGPLFAWYTEDGSRGAVLAQEAAVREAIGRRGALATPPIMARGANWRLEPAVDSEPIRGRALDVVLEAAAVIPDLTLPPAADEVGRERRLPRLRRRLRVLRSAIPRTDALRARRILARSELPRALSHGDFHPGHVLPSGDVAWVVDWELAGPRPAGYDLMTLWAHLDDDDDRERVLEGAVRMVGSRHSAELLRLRYAVAVLVMATNVSEPALRNRDPERVRALLRRLPELRSSAGA